VLKNQNNEILFYKSKISYIQLMVNHDHDHVQEELMPIVAAGEQEDLEIDGQVQM
jgi:hypothetical protein